MAKITRLLGRPPEDNVDIPYRKSYFRGDRKDRFQMRRQGDFYTSIFAYGGRGRNTVELPFSTSDISYSSITRGGSVCIQFRTAIGEDGAFPQTIHLDGVRKIDLLDQTLRVNRIYRDDFGRDLPRLPSERRTQWISNGLWDEFAQRQGKLDTLTGKSRGSNNFYLSGANNDAIIEGSKKSRATDTLYFDEYESVIDLFLRKPGNANIRVGFVNIEDTEETRATLFKARNLERLVLRDAYFERGKNRWRRFSSRPAGTFESATDLPEEEQPNYVQPQGDSVFSPIPDDIFNPAFVSSPATDTLA